MSRITSTPGRWLAGMSTNITLFVVVWLGGLVAWFFVGTNIPLMWVREHWGRWDKQIFPDYLPADVEGVLISMWLFGPWVAGLVFLRGWVKERIGAGTGPVRRELRRARFGKGGAAGFAGLLGEWALRWRKGGVRLGSSLYDRRWIVGPPDDRHVLTIGAPRAGKGRSAIIPNLLTWPGSALVIDPKGTNAAVTAAARGFGGGLVKEWMGQVVHVLDPFGIVPGEETAVFNPLDVIDPASPRFVEDIGLVTDALVVAQHGRDSVHWDESAVRIISGIIAHLLTGPPREFAAGGRSSLIDLRNVITSGPDERDEFFGQMMENQAAGGLPAAAASLVATAGPNELGSMMTTVMRNTDWLDSPAIQGVLGESDFEMGDLKNDPTTIYLVLPPELLNEHRRFLRLFVNLAVRSMSRGGKGRYPVLFLLDEFYSLGELKVMQQAAAVLAGYGMKLWPFVQNISQLHELYPKNWEAFLSGAWVQVFGVNDLATEEYVSRRLGRTAMDLAGHRVVAQLREANELEQEVSRASGRQIVLNPDGDPLLLRRQNYDRTFKKRQYSPDPDIRGS